MKILHVINTLDYGGAERLLFNFATHINREFQDIKLEVCTLLYKGDLGAKLQQMSITVHDLSCGKWDAVKIVQKLNHLISKNKYDIVHVHLFPALYYVRLVRSLNNGPVYIFTEHSTVNRRRKYKWLKLIESSVYEGYDAIIANSKATKKELITWLPNLEHKVRIIENGIPLTSFIKRSYELSTPPKLLVVARIVKSKGIDIAIDAVDILKKRGFDVTLTIVGDGPEREKLEKYAQGLDVHFMGYYQNPLELMVKHDILLVPSRWEGFGLVAIEGMQVGIPIIASDIPGLREVVENGQTGLLFSPNDAKALAESIEILLKNKDLREQLGTYGREEVFKRWSIDRFVCEVLSLYEELLKEKDYDG